MKVTVAEPYSFNYGGEQYQAGDEVDVPIGAVTASPWVFEETQDDVTTEQRQFLDKQADVQRQLSQSLAGLQGSEAVE